MKKPIVLLLCLFVASNLIAQNIDGKIQDENGLPLPNAVVYVKSYKQHTHSDLQGNFTIKNASPGDSLHVQFLGFKKFSKKITNQDISNPIIITLQETDYLLDQVYIDNSLLSINTISKIDLDKNPVKSSQEILQKVPGLFIAQHAGGGKAEQIFLRGFDIDHGTDIDITVDGVPVNMVSHAHGQGYADLHFVIPETIENIDFGKGPYYANKGNFNTAGYVDFKLKERLENSQITLEVGDFNTYRTVALMPVLSSDSEQFYVAAEYLLSDGPFESSQNFNRLNFLGRYTKTMSDKSQLSFTGTHFNSSWDASGQIPQRLVDNGTIGRFGAVDDTEGGYTSRSNFNLEYTRYINNHSFHKTNVFYSNYNFELYSNFTFFLNDPVNGDQIRQKENRNIYGLNSVFVHEKSLGTIDMELNAGFGFRYDDVSDSELSRTKNRTETLSRVSLGDIDETNFNGFINPVFRTGHWSFNPSVRYDIFNFQYLNQLSSTYDKKSVNKAIFSPKFNISYNPTLNLQLFLKTGKGFHSNDSRVILTQDNLDIIPAAYSADIGAEWKPTANLWISAALWYLHLDQEFVYVGDEGVVEPSGKTKRKGVELSLRQQVNKNIYFYSDFNYTIARAVDVPEGENFIPLAPDLSILAGLNFNLLDKVNLGLKSRYIKTRPANEDNSIQAEGYFIIDLNLNYKVLNNLNLGITVENLMDSEWNEAQFATLSRLQDEVEPVEEIHFTPGVPRFVKARLSYSF